MAFRDLKTTTIREFDGGLNVVNDDLNMDKKYSTIETNVFNNINGTKAKRYGTKFIKDIKNLPIQTDSYDDIKTKVNKKLEIIYDRSLLVKENRDTVQLIHADGSESSADFVIKEVQDAFLVIENPNGILNEENNDIVAYRIYNYTYDNVQRSNDISSKALLGTNNTFRLTRLKDSQLYIGDEITITEAPDNLSSLVNNSYKIIEINSDGKDSDLYGFPTITIDISETDISFDESYFRPDVFGVILYTKKQDPVIDKYVRYGSYRGDNFNNIVLYEYRVDLLLYKKSYNKNLLIGHTIDIYTTEDYSDEPLRRLVGDYDTEEVNDESNNLVTKSYYTIKNVNNLYDNVTKVYLKFDNRNIKGNKIVGCEYFIDKMILVSDLGEIIATDSADFTSIIWNNDIATAINYEKSATAWGDTTSVCFALFNGKLTVWNGVDKPVVIDFFNKIPCNFIYDPYTGTNTYIPRAKYALAFNHYLICGNIIDDDGTEHRDRLSISAYESMGVFYSGSSDPEDDSVEIDLGNIVSTNKQIIKGISRYRDKIVVGFDDVSVFGTLGEYTEVEEKSADGETTYTVKKHTPKFEDVIDDHGCICNKTYATIQSELICLDYNGLPLFRRTGLNAIILPQRISNLISPKLYKSYNGLNENLIENNIFAVRNPKDSQYLLFIPEINEQNEKIGTTCYAYTAQNTNNRTAVIGAWSIFTGWNFDCGLTSALNDVYLIKDTKIYQLGNVDYPYYADFINDPDYVDEDGNLTGKEIEFDWEFPWADFGDRSATKHSRYLAISSTGNSPFSIDFFTDYIYYNNYHKKLDPALTLNFLAGDSHGWGNGKQSYGGGRITNNEQLFAWTTKFKIAKIRIHGASKDKLNVNSITLYYQMGNIRR